MRIARASERAHFRHATNFRRHRLSDSARRQSRNGVPCDRLIVRGNSWWGEIAVYVDARRTSPKSKIKIPLLSPACCALTTTGMLAGRLTATINTHKHTQMTFHHKIVPCFTEAARAYCPWGRYTIKLTSTMLYAHTRKYHIYYICITFINVYRRHLVRSKCNLTLQLSGHN